MKAYVATKYGGPEVLELVELERPKVGPNEILVKIHATAVNSGDVRVRGLQVEGFLKVVMRLVLGFNKPRKPVLGIVFSGVVAEKGALITHFDEADAIFGMTGFSFGTFAEYVVIKEKSSAVLKPKNANHEEAVALVFGGTTALYFLRKAGLENMNRPRVLIYGATGAVGTSAVQLAKHYGAHVTAVCGPSGMDLAKSLGADEVLDYTQNWQNNAKNMDLVFDCVGKIKKKDCKEILNQRGKFLTVDSLDTARESKEQLALLAQLFDAGKLQPVIDKTFDFKDMQAAHAYVDSGRKKGNVVVRVG